MAPELTPTQRIEGPVTVWINGLRSGDSRATEGLWGMYFRRMRGLAHRLLRGKARRTCDGEDMAASAFRSFYEGVRAGQFSKLQGRVDLWSLLAARTSHKCVDRMRREGRAKRGGRDAAAGDSRLVNVAGESRGPVSRVELMDLRGRLFEVVDAVGDPALRTILEMKLEGEPIEAIARRLGCVRRTVERKLKLIQELWESEMP